MTRSSSEPLASTNDPERLFRNKKKAQRKAEMSLLFRENRIKAAEQAATEATEVPEGEQEVVEVPKARTMGPNLVSYFQASEVGIRPAIVVPPIRGVNFELKHQLITMAQQNQFSGMATEDPNKHLARFLELCSTVHVERVADEAIRLMLFPFSLTGAAEEWLHRRPPGSITTWAELQKVFLAKFFPAKKMIQLMDEITNFRQIDGETLSEAWERFKYAVNKCPGHGFPDERLLQIFYSRLDAENAMILDSRSGGDFWLNNDIVGAAEILDRLAEYDTTRWGDRRMPRGSVDRAMQSQLDSIEKKLAGLAGALKQGTVQPVKMLKTREEVQQFEEEIGDYGAEEANFVGAPQR